MSVMAIIADVIGRNWGYGTILTNSQDSVLVSLLRILQRPMWSILAHILSLEGDTHMPDLRSFWGCPMIWSLWHKIQITSWVSLILRNGWKVEETWPTVDTQYSCRARSEIRIQSQPDELTILSLGPGELHGVLPWFVHIYTIILCVPG